MSNPLWKCSRCGWVTNDLPSNHKCARCMTWLEAVPCAPALPGVTVKVVGDPQPVHTPPEVSALRIELGSVRGDGETSCTIRGGAGMFVGTLPKGLWRLYLERVE